MPIACCSKILAEPSISSHSWIIPAPGRLLEPQASASLDGLREVTV
jgi:hypothetical protein